MAKINSGINGTKKEKIVQQAAALFKAKSYNAASMRELAVALGVEAPSLYNHIGAKSELLQAICFEVGAKFTEQIQLIESSNITAIAKIETIIRFHIQTTLQHFDEVYVSNHEWKHLPEPFLNDFLNIRRNYEKSLTHLVETAITQNEIRKTNPYVAVLTILSAVRGLEFWQRNRKNVSPRVLEDDMVNHLINGLKK